MLKGNEPMLAVFPHSGFSMARGKTLGRCSPRFASGATLSESSLAVRSAQLCRVPFSCPEQLLTKSGQNADESLMTWGAVAARLRYMSNPL